MKSLTLLFVSAAMVSPIFGLAAEMTNPQPVTTSFTTTLGQLGYPGGFTFEDTSLPNERTLFFPLPQDMPVKEAILRIIFRGSSHLHRRASFQVAFNNLPAEEILLMPGKDTREWLISVPPEAISGGTLKVSIRGNIPTAYTSCIDGQPQKGVVHIAADSGLVTIQDGVPQSLRDAWLAMPDEVVIAIPDRALDETSYKHILDWVVLLQRRHHTVRITTLPNLGHLVIAPENEIIAAMAFASGVPAERKPLWNKPGNNIGVVEIGSGAFIAVTSPAVDAQRFAERWQSLIKPAFFEPKLPAHVETHVENISLETLGVPSSTAFLGHELQWKATLAPWDLPSGTEPITANIYFALPRTDTEQELRIFVYLNDILVKSQRVIGYGEERKISVDFADVSRSASYELRLVIRDGGAEDCTAPIHKYPVRITQHSNITVQKQSLPPSGFSSIPTALGHGFDLYVPKSYLLSGQHHFSVLGQILSGFAVSAENYKLIMVDDGQPFAPQRNFIAAGDNPPDGLMADVRFDQGRVRLVDYKENTLISERSLRRKAIVQIVRVGSVAGLWLHPGEVDAVPPIDAIHLGNDDLAIYEPDNLLLSIDSHQYDLAHMQYADSPRWFERLHRQRTMWLLVAWVLLTLGIVYLYLKSKQHRRI